ncbi:hypothetical protein ABZ845_14830 [Streptomyces sp. NPDC047022]|uniref:hypothetical protein n=1 Tax=Streptomyces sp. NPDC047022 TaxID=3155737 RepID=UPI0033DE03E2
MKAPTQFKALTGAPAGRWWVCVAAVMALVGGLGPGAAAEADHSGAAPRCLVGQRPPRGTKVEVPATTGPARFPGATRPVDSGVCVRRAVQVTAAGVIGSGIRTDVGPDGDTATLAGTRFPLAGVPRWSLMGRVGDGPWRYIGAGPTVLPGDGELYLAVDDDRYGDNSGVFRAGVSRCTCGTRCGLFDTDLADDSLSGLGAACFERGTSSRPHGPGRPRP